MNIVRSSRRERGYTIIENSILEDKELTIKEIGLLCYLLKFPDDWVFNKKHLHNELKGGREYIDSAFSALIKAGYIVKEEVRDKGRFLGYIYKIYENKKADKPLTENPSTVSKKASPQTGKPYTDKPLTENPNLLNTNNTKTKVHTKVPLSTNVDKGRPENSFLDFEDLQPKSETKPKEKKKRPAKNCSSDPVYKEFVEVYFNFYKSKTGAKPMFNGRDGLAMNEIIKFMRNAVSEKHPGADPDQQGKMALNGFGWILSRWDKLKPYHQQKISAHAMASEFNTIYKEILNPAKNGKKPTGGDVANEDIARASRAYFEAGGKF